MNVLAIDQGTSSTKALLVADGGEVLGEASVPVHPRSAPAGAVEQDPEELLASVLAAGRKALREAAAEAHGGRPRQPGRDGPALGPRQRTAALGPALSWQDRRAVVVTRELADRAERLTELTGLPLDPYFAAPKMSVARDATTGARGRH